MFMELVLCCRSALTVHGRRRELLGRVISEIYDTDPAICASIANATPTSAAGLRALRAYTRIMSDANELAAALDALCPTEDYVNRLAAGPHQRR